MAFDPSTLPAAVRLEYLRIGWQFGTPHVLNQRTPMVQALAANGADGVGTGFEPDDQIEFEEIEHDGATGGRGVAVVQRRTGTKEVRGANAKGKTARQPARGPRDGRGTASQTDSDVTTARKTLFVAPDAEPRTAGNPKHLLDQLVALTGAFDTSTSWSSPPPPEIHAEPRPLRSPGARRVDEPQGPERCMVPVPPEPRLRLQERDGDRAGAASAHRGSGDGWVTVKTYRREIVPGAKGEEAMVRVVLSPLSTQDRSPSC